MGDILSPEELDALLKGLAEGSVGGEDDAPGEDGGVQLLDIFNQESSVRGRLPGLELILDRFTRQLRIALGGFFGQLPTVNRVDADVVRFGGVLERLPSPVGLQLFTLSPLRGQGMIVVAPKLVNELLQIFFGGSPSHKTPLTGGEFTQLGQRVLERLGGRILAEFRAAWTPVTPLACEFVRSETNPRFVSIAGPEDQVLLIQIEIQVPGCEEGLLSICMPNASLAPIFPRLQTAGGERAPEDTAWASQLHAAVCNAELEVSAELGRHHMAMRDVLALQPGDLIPLGTGAEGPVVVCVAGRPRFLAAPGISGGNNAVRVTGPV